MTQWSAVEDAHLRSAARDRLRGEAETTRATLHRPSAGRQDLAVAYLQAVDGHIRAQIDALVADGVEPEQLLRCIAEGIADDIRGPGFRGCPFLKAAAEHPDTEGPAHQTVLAHRR